MSNKNFNHQLKEGITEHQLGNLHKAIDIYTRILKTDPSNFDAVFFMATAEAQTKNRQVAIKLFTRAIEINPNSPDCYFNLATALKEEGHLNDALHAYSQATTLNPNYGNAHYNRGLILTTLNLIDEAIKSYQYAIATDSNKEIKFSSAVYLSVLNYLNLDFQKSKDAIKLCKGRMANISDYFIVEKVYYIYITKLLDWHNQNKTKITSDKCLHIIGESHSLSYHGINVNYDNGSYSCIANWIAGCKQWHLGDSKCNIYKDQFTRIASSIPLNSIVLLTIGEIDCRINDGILKYCRKNKHLNQKEIAKTIIENYIQFVIRMTENYKWHTIIQGIPSPNTNSLNLSSEDQKELTDFILFFNSTLKSMALDCGLGFLDVHALVMTGSDSLNYPIHIDSYHLSPSAIKTAFDRHLTLPKNSYCI